MYRAGLEDRGADRHRGRTGDQDDPRRPGWGRRWWNRPIPCGSRIPTSRPCRRISGARWPGWCPSSCPSCCSGWGRTDSPSSRSSRRRSCRPSSCPARSSARAPCSRSTTCVELAEGRIAPPANLDIATIQEQELAMAFRFHIPQYLTRRAADWKARGFTETLVDFPTLNARSKFWGDDQRAAFKNWEEVTDPRNPPRPAPGRQRAHHAARIAAPGGHDGDPGESSGRAGPPAHAVSAGQDRRRLPAGHAPAICASSRSTVRTRA